MGAAIFPLAMWVMLDNSEVDDGGGKAQQRKTFEQRDASKEEQERVARERAASKEKYNLGGPFTVLSAETGKPVTNEEIFTGKWSLLYFGFSKCAEICPTTMKFVTEVMNEADKKFANSQHKETVKSLQCVFLSIDHIRDNRNTVKAFLKPYHKRTIGLYGTKEQVAAAARAWRIYYSSVDETEEERTKREAAGAPPPAPIDDNYQFDHSAAIYLVGPDGKIKDFFFKEVGVENTCKRIGLHFDDAYDLN